MDDDADPEPDDEWADVVALVHAARQLVTTYDQLAADPAVTLPAALDQDMDQLRFALEGECANCGEVGCGGWCVEGDYDPFGGRTIVNLPDIGDYRPGVAS